MNQVSTGRVNVLDKRIFGGESDLNQLVPFAHPWAWQAYQDANKNHWLPGHFQLATDPAIVHSDQQQVLELYFGWRLAISTAVLEALPQLYRNCTSPECRQYILRHMQEESVAIKAISESGFLDLPNMGLWVVAQAKRIEESMPHALEMSAAAFAVLVSAILVYKAYVNVDLETWLMKETQLPPELRRMVKALQRDGVHQRNFYTNMLRQFLIEQPRMEQLVIASTIETATDEAMAGFRLHWFNRDLTPVVADKPVQFARYCWTSCLSQIGLPVSFVTSPYQEASVKQQPAAKSQTALSWD